MAKRRKNQGSVSKFANAGITMRRLGFTGELSSKSYDTLAKRQAWIKRMRAMKLGKNPRPRTPTATWEELGIMYLVIAGVIGYTVGKSRLS